MKMKSFIIKAFILSIVLIPVQDRFVFAEDLMDLEDGLGRFVSFSEPVKFLMGSPEKKTFVDETQHQVTLSPFEISSTVVRQEVYVDWMGENPSRFKTLKDCPEPGQYHERVIKGLLISYCKDYPVENVRYTWVTVFINKINEKLKSLGYRYSLPTEAQWEYAFNKGFEALQMLWGSPSNPWIGNFFWFLDNSEGHTHVVDSTQSNAFGIHSGSVTEWVYDFYGDYPSEPVIDPQGIVRSKDWKRVVRGCGWGSPIEDCLTMTRRDFANHLETTENRGFRLERQKSLK